MVAIKGRKKTTWLKSWEKASKIQKRMNRGRRKTLNGKLEKKLAVVVRQRNSTKTRGHGEESTTSGTSKYTSFTSQTKSIQV